jgi:hypothetical protein
VVNPNDELEKRLRSIRSASSLNVAPSESTKTSVLRNAQLGLRDYGIESIRKAPSLSEKIAQIASGTPQPSKNPAIGAALLPLKALSAAGRVFSTPLYGVASGVREIVDAIDNNPDTKASMSDFTEQMFSKDYGFGTAFPMKGNKGRALALIADLGLDPINWATFGGTILPKVALKGVAEVAGKEGAEILVRDVLGKYVGGRQGAEALAVIVEKELRTANLVEGAAKLSDREIGDIVGRVYSRNWSAIPEEIAKKYSINPPGIYYAGSRFRVPGSKIVGEFGQRGLIGGRLWFVNTKVGQKIARAFMPGRTAEVAASMMGKVNVRQLRTELRAGRLTGEEAAAAVAALGVDQMGRMARSVVKSKATEILKPFVVGTKMATFAHSVSRLMEQGAEELAKSAPAAERELAQEMTGIMKKFYGEIESVMKTIDTDFQIGTIESYFPHVLSEQAQAAANNLANPRSELIRQYAKFKGHDISGSFKSRTIKAGQGFLEDLGGPRAEDGGLLPNQVTVIELNKITQKLLGFPMFETDARKVLLRYADHYASAMGDAAMMREMLSKPYLMDTIKKVNGIDVDVLNAHKKDVGNLISKKLASGERLSAMLKKTTEDYFGTPEKAGRLPALLERLEKQSTDLTGQLNTPEQVDALRNDIAAKFEELTTIQAEYVAQREAVSAILGEQDGILKQITIQEAEAIQEFEEIGQTLNRILVDSYGYAPDAKLVDGVAPKAPNKLDQVIVDNAPNKAAMAEHLASVQFLMEKLNARVIQLDKMNELYNILGVGENLEQIFKEAMESVDGGDFVNNVLDGLGATGARKKYTRTTNAQGKLPANWVDDFWGGTAQDLDANILLLRNMIDPHRTITSASLKKMKIGDVRAILSKSTVGVDRVDELRKAVAWLIIRDVHHSPQILIDIANLQSAGGVADGVSQTAIRFWKLKSYMETSAELSQHLKKQALVGTFSGEDSASLSAELAPLFRKQSRAQVASLPEEIAGLESTLIRKRSELSGPLSEKQRKSLNYDISKLEQRLSGKRHALKVGQSSGRGTDQVRMVTTAQHLEKAILERNEVFQQYQDVISEISFNQGITPGQSIQKLVNEALQKNPSKLGEIVSDSDLDTVLISIRSATNTKFDIEPPMSADFLSDADVFDPVLDDVFSGDLLETEIPSTLEAVRGIITYEKLQDFAATLMDVQDVKYVDTYEKVRPIGDLVAEKADFERRLDHLDKEVLPSIERNILPVQKDVYEIISKQGKQAALITEFQSALDISMVLSETNLNWANLNQALEDITGSGNLVGLGDQQWQIMLSLNAKVHADALNAANVSLGRATELIEGVRTEVLKIQDVSRQGEALAFHMSKLLNGPDGAAVKSNFPEFEAMLRTKGMSKQQSGELAHPAVSKVRDQLVDTLVMVKVRAETPGVSSTMRRHGNPLAGDGTDFLRTTGGSGSEAYQEAMIRGSAGTKNAKSILKSVRDQLALDKPRVEQGAKKLKLTESEARTVERLEQRLRATRGTATPLEQRELAEDILKIQYGNDSLIEPPYNWGAVEVAVNDLETDLDDAMRLLRDDMATESRRAELEIKIGRASRPERARTRRARDAFGFGSTFNSAIRSNRGNWAVRRFFNETVGGAPMQVGDSGFRRPWSISNVAAENRVASSMRTNTLANSQAGRAQHAGFKRRSMMLAIADPMLARASADNIMNGMSGDNPISPVFLAEALEYRVQSLANRLQQNEVFRKLIADEAVLLEQLDKRLPYSEAQIKYIKELALEQSEPIQTKNGLRVRPTTPAETARLSEQQAADLKEVRQLRLQAAKLRQDPQFAIAQQQKTRFAVLEVLAKIDGDRVVTMDGAPQWGTHSSYETHVFGDPQFEPLTDDLLIERLLGGRGGRDIELMGSNLNKRPRNEAIINQVRTYGEVKWDFLPRGTSIHAVRMEQVDFIPGMTDADYVFVAAGGERIGAFDAQVAVGSGQPITVLKPITPDGSLGGANRLQELSLRKGESFTPKETWLISPAGEYLEYTRGIGGGALGSRAEGAAMSTQPMVSPDGVPLIKSRVVQYVRGQEANNIVDFTMPNGAPLSFSKDEWDSLFLPFAPHEKTLVNIEKEVLDAKRDEASLIAYQRTNEYKKLSKSAKIKHQAALVSATNRKLALREQRQAMRLQPLDSYTFARVRSEIAKTQEYINNLQTRLNARGGNFLDQTGRTNVKAKLETANRRMGDLEAHQKKITVSGTAAAKIDRLVELAGTPQVARALGVKPQQGGKTFDSSKVLKALVERMQESFAKDGKPLASSAESVAERVKGTKEGWAFTSGKSYLETVAAADSTVTDAAYFKKINEDFEPILSEMSSIRTKIELIKREQYDAVDQVELARDVVGLRRAQAEGAEGFAELPTPKYTEADAESGVRLGGIQSSRNDIAEMSPHVKDINLEIRSLSKEINDLERRKLLTKGDINEGLTVEAADRTQRRTALIVHRDNIRKEIQTQLASIDNDAQWIISTLRPSASGESRMLAETESFIRLVREIKLKTDSSSVVDAEEFAKVMADWRSKMDTALDQKARTIDFDEAKEALRNILVKRNETLALISRQPDNSAAILNAEDTLARAFAGTSRDTFTSTGALKKSTAPTSYAGKRLAEIQKAAAPVRKTKNELTKATDALHKAVVLFDYAEFNSLTSAQKLSEVQERISAVKILMEASKGLAAQTPETLEWNKAAQELLDEVAVFGNFAFADSGKVDKTFSDWAKQYIALKAAHLENTANENAARNIFQKATSLHLAASGFPTVLLPGFEKVEAMPEGWGAMISTMKDGWIHLDAERFPNIQVHPELAKLYENVNRIQSPLMAQELSRLIGGYTKFFKAYATLSPGFHVRNAISNAMQHFAGGGNPRYLMEGLQVTTGWGNASRSGKSWEQFLTSLTPEQAKHAQVARDSVFGSGGGLFEFMFDGIRGTNRMSSNFVVNKSKSAGQASDNFSRFLFGYDASKQGLGVEQATARTARFFIDYEDISSADEVIRQIIPFWMWTSRSLPVHMMNMWTNPKPYGVYRAIKRNLKDDDDETILPEYMQLSGAFKLPFGDNLYANPEFGFTQIDKRINDLENPRKLLGDMNPLLRVPMELAAGKSFFNNRKFSENPVKVSGGIQNILQPLLEQLGMGNTNAAGETFVQDDKYYAFRNLLPFLGSLERLSPTVDTENPTNNNAVAGWFGSPVKQYDENMQASQLNKLKGLIAKEVSRNKAVNG